MKTERINHKTIGSGDVEPRRFALFVTPFSFDEIIAGRGIVSINRHRCPEPQKGDIVELKETRLHKPKSGEYRSADARIVSLLPPISQGYNTVVIRLVNEKSLYARFRAFLSRSLGSLTLSRRG